MRVMNEEEIQAALERYAVFPGFCAKEKVWFMYELSKSLNQDLVVEVGVYGGRTLLPMALGSRKAQVVGIDAWRSEECLRGEKDEYAETWRVHDFESVYRTAKRDIESEGLGIQIIRGDHLVVVNNFPDNSIDLLHEDANHSPTIIRKSMDAWIPKVKTGGTIVWDDPGWGNGWDVVRYVREDCGLELIESRSGYDVLRKVRSVR